MASSGKKKTTMAKLMRESRVRERRLAKKVRKDARQHSPLTDVDQIDASAVDPDGNWSDPLDPAQVSGRSAGDAGTGAGD